MTVAGTLVLSSRNWLWPGAMLLIAAAVALLWTSWRVGGVLWVRILCGTLKFTGIAALILCLLGPVWVSPRARPGANVFAVLADNSQSLQVRDPGSHGSRGALLQQELTTDPKGWQNALAKTFQLRRYSFDSRLQSLRDFNELNFEGRSSALGGALKSAIERWRGQPVAGVLLFTDGNATDLASQLPSLDGAPPIFPVVLGEDSALRDISVDKVSVSQTAFEDAPVTVQAAVTAQGFAGSEVQAQITELADSAATNSRSPKTIASLTQNASSSASSLDFRFQIQPETPGLHFYQLDVRSGKEAGHPDETTQEATLENNRRIIAVDRGQEPFRILCVAGRPDWEYKFLNRALLEDSQVHMVTLLRIAKREPRFSFKGRAGEGSNPLFRGFGAATNEDTARYDQPVTVRLNTKDALELRGNFPKTAEELFKYQAIILDRVEAEFFTHEQMLLMRRFVAERGGGFLMLGGAETFYEGGYAETAVASMLPVYLDRPAEVHLPSSFKWELTREGWLQPWTRLRATEADERARLASMPAFQVLNPIRDSKPGASVLATVADAQDHRFPALVVEKFGSGTTAALMVGDLWRWGMLNESMQRDLGKSWRQLIRWLVSDVPGRVAVEAQATDEPTQFRLVVKVRDEEYKPLDNAEVRLRVRKIGFRTGGDTSTNAQSELKPLEITAGSAPAEPGRYETTYVARDAGAYCVEASVSQSDGKEFAKAQAGWTAEPAADEFRSLKPNRPLLETIARRTGGELVKMSDLRRFAERLPERAAPITESVSQPLWHEPALYLFVLGCFLTDWGVRRWKGLP